MKREIKFRAWNNDIKWMSKPFSFGQVLNFHDQIIKTLTNDEIIMQFTGLQDKKGVDIYDGDIIRHGIAKAESTVEFIEGSFVLSQNHSCIRHYDINQCEVIGNIYEKQNS
jgi:hypothetical protein